MNQNHTTGKKAKHLLAVLLAFVLMLGIAFPAGLAGMQVYAEGSVSEEEEQTEVSQDASSQEEPAQEQPENAERVLTAQADGLTFTARGNFSADVTLAVSALTAEVNDYICNNILGLETSEESVSSNAYDITLMENGVEIEPDDSVVVTVTGMDTTAESAVDVYHLPGTSEADVYAEMNAKTAEAGGRIDVEPVSSTVGEGYVQFTADSFSIYVVTNQTANDWNRNNYQIMMTVGDSQNVTTSTGTTGGSGPQQRSSYSWSIVSGNTQAFSLTNTNQKTATITAKAAGQVTLQCTITTGKNQTTETITVIALSSVGSSYKDDIIFANVTAAHTSDNAETITEYGNTYGPYVMKIRFEDPDGNLLTMGDQYYVFDSACPININTFAADAPAGYTYDGSYFYWTGHYSGEKAYVSKVTRLSSLGNYGSYLYYDYVKESITGVQTNTHYQPSGVLHVVYRKSTEAYSVVFQDHDGTVLHSFAPAKADTGYATIPAAYVTELDTTLNTQLNNNHSKLTDNYTFSGNWVVTGGGQGIDGTYTTAQLKTQIPNWKIKSNITIKAQCAASNATITITKALAGNMYNPSEAFSFTATLDGDYTFPEPAANAGYTVANNKVSFSLKDGDSVTLSVPVGAKLTISESQNDYTMSAKQGETGLTVTNNAVTVTIGKENAGVTVTNTKDVTINTGISMDVLPYIILLVAAVVGAGAYGVIRKRRRQND